MNRRRPIFLILLAIGLPLLLTLPGQGAAPGKVTILLLDRLSLAELATDAGPFLREKIHESARALITTNTAGTRSPGNTHATLGAGSPALSDQPGGLALNFDEKWMGVEAGRLYQQLTGDPTFPAGKVVIPRLAEAHRLNFTPARVAVPCLLGTVLKENHLTTAVLGNADPAPPTEDATNAHHRFGPWLAADRRGLVDHGDVGDRTLQRAEGVLPWETDYRYLVAKYGEYREKADFIVLELGDFARLDALTPYLFDRQIRAERTRLFVRLDQFLQTLWSLLDWEQDLLILLTPTPSLANLKAGAYLTPCLIWGKAFPPGLLSSPTTRRPGLISNVDLAPTIFHHFNLETPAYTTGRVISSLPGGEFSALLRIEKKISAISLSRRKIIPVFLNSAAFLFPLLLLAAGLPPILPIPHESRAVYQARLVFFPLFLSALPLALHLASQLSLFSLWGFAGTVLGLAIFFSVLSWKWGNRQRIGSWPSLLPLILFTFLIPLDLLVGAPLVKTSVLGYDPMLGARYYGIGNELAGLFLGSSLGLLLWIGQRKESRPLRPWAFGLYLSSVVILAFPGLGANFGAGLSALAMALILFPRPTRSAQWRRRLPLYFLVLIFFVAALFAGDHLLDRPEDQSHLGLLLKDYQTRGLSAVSEIVFRKLQVNLRLFSTRWAWLLLSALLTFVVSFLRNHATFRLFLFTALGGGLTGLLFNDSGVVFAALFFYPLAATGLITFLGKREN